jgi:hypothetical protein
VDRACGCGDGGREAVTGGAERSGGEGEQAEEGEKMKKRQNRRERVESPVLSKCRYSLIPFYWLH